MRLSLSLLLLPFCQATLFGFKSSDDPTDRKLPLTYLHDGTFYDRETKAEVPMNSSSVLFYSADEVLYSHEYFLNRNTLKYGMIDLGSVGDSWSAQQYDEACKTLKYCARVRNLLGFVISEDKSAYSAPYVKLALRNIKEYLLLNKVPGVVGLLGEVSPELDKYLHCDNLHLTPDFYYESNTTGSSNGTESTVSGFVFPRQRNIQCGPLQARLGFNTNTLPYTPRLERCNCMESALECQSANRSCIPHPDLPPVISTPLYWENTTLRQAICSEVYCGFLEDNPQTGTYGALAGCSNEQKDSLALNLYYTYHGSKQQYCDWDGLAQPQSDTNFTETLSQAQSRTVLNDFTCKDEIPDDWARYLVGVSSRNVSSNGTVSAVRDRVYEPDLTKVFKNTGSVVGLSWMMVMTVIGLWVSL